MFVPAFSLHAVRAHEFLPQPGAGDARHIGTQNSVAIRLEHAAFCQSRTVNRQKSRLRSNNAKAAKTVSDCNRHHAGDPRIVAQKRETVERDIPGGGVHMIDGRQDELQRRSLGTHHEINAL